MPPAPKRERDAGLAAPKREREGGFVRRVLTAVTRIPPGRVATYGDIAVLAGRPGAARAVGNIMARASRPGVPYHRVIAAGGALGGYSNLGTKRALLAAEGHRVTRTRVQRFEQVRWPGP